MVEKISLANPTWSAATTTTAAVATAGLSLLGRGLWNRIAAGNKVCRIALRQISEDDAAAAEKPTRDP